jgi:phosphohistidine phosphatase SixA
LNKRGKADLILMSELLSEDIKKPDCIVASPAKRTIKTAEAYAKAR